MKNKILALGFFINILLLLSAHAATVYSYTCAQTYRTVQVGNTMDAVRAACGEPTSNTTQDTPVNTPIEVTQWVYTASVKIKDNTVSIPVLAITFQNQRVSQIEKTSIAAPVSTYCASPGAINVGDSQTNVLAVCGQPNIVNSKQKANTATKQVTRWIYNFGPYKPQVIFDFEGGVLKQISS